MKLKFTKYERVAGVFVGLTIFGALTAFVFIAIQKGWFESKIPLQTKFQTADGITPGTNVHMNGLRVGSVEDVVLGRNNEVVVKFYVTERVFDRVRKDSVVQTFRPFVIADKVLEVTVGSESSARVDPGHELKSVESMDLMDLVGGRRLGPYVESLSEMIENMSVVLEAFKDPKRVESLIIAFDELAPMMKEMHKAAWEFRVLSKQASRSKRLQKVLNGLLVTTGHFNVILPEFAAVVKSSPEMGKNAAQIIANLAALTEEMKKLIPAIAAVAPELPEASKRAMEAMTEAVITLKAMQRSFLLKGAVEDIREEEAKEIEAELKKKEEENPRVPANE